MTPQRILIAPDKFKGTLTSDEAARAIEKGLRRAWPKAKTTRFTLTDGGEGFVEMMVRQTGGRLRTLGTIDAVGKSRAARWGVLGNGKTAVIGLNEASGLAYLSADMRDPEKTSNIGTGKIIGAAVQAGFREILVGLGGSATTEGGISLAAAIGYRFLDKQGDPISLTGGGLAQLDRILSPQKMPRAKFIVATDVSNPLYGAKGAAFQFGPQKGADAAMVGRLDANLRRLERIVKRDLARDVAHQPGAGSAGGCGYGLMAFFQAKREDGFQLVRRQAGLDGLIRANDLIVTGEGCFDRTSLLGKAPSQIAALAKKLKKPVWALCGRADLPLAKSPFNRLATLSARGDPAPDARTPHAQRLEELAYLMAKETLT